MCWMYCPTVFALKWYRPFFQLLFYKSGCFQGQQQKKNVIIQKKKKCCPTGVPAHRQLSVVWQHRGCIPAVGAVVTLGAVLSVCFTVSLIEHNGHRCFSSLYYSSAFLHSWFITGLYLHLHSYFTLIINWYWLKQLWSLCGRNVLLYTFEYCFKCPNYICIVLSAYFFMTSLPLLNCSERPLHVQGETKQSV